jgi:hypothetical protein
MMSEPGQLDYMSRSEPLWRPRDGMWQAVPFALSVATFGLLVAVDFFDMRRVPVELLYVLWFAPFAFSVLGIGRNLYRIRKRQHRSRAERNFFAGNLLIVVGWGFLTYAIVRYPG